MNSEEKDLDAAAKDLDTLRKSLETPGKSLDTPGKSLETPGKSLETPEKSLDTLGKGLDTLGKGLDALDIIRNKIDNIDNDMQRLFEERMNCAKEVALYKQEHSMPIFVPERENKIIVDKKNRTQNPEIKEEVESFFRALMNISKLYQKRLVNNVIPGERTQIAFQGVLGAFSESAVYQAFGEKANAMPCENFSDVIDAVIMGRASHGVLPIENSTGGAINEVYDLIGSSSCKIVGEEIVHVKQCLMGLEQSEISSIKTVYSHPQGLRQCAKYLAELGIDQIPYYDTAAAALLVAERKDAQIAAIASSAAAKRYGLKILAADINDRNDNFTRFVVISKDSLVVYGKGKASFAFTVNHKSGSLHAVLTHLATKQLNMTKLESRNIPGNPWEYRFYLDFEGDVSPCNIIEVESFLKLFCSEYMLLGCYYPAERL